MSIEVTEFRIGNYVNTKYGNLKVFTINELGLEIQDNSGWIDYINSENLKPIELTEEILLKIKGVKQTGLTFIIDKYILWLYDGKSYAFMLYNEKDDLSGDLKVYSTELTKVKYLHQLQNLYFALTNQELEIKL